LLYYLRMKNIFKINIKLPSRVKLRLKETLLFVEGPQGSVCLDVSFFSTGLPMLETKKMQYSSFFRLFQKALIGVCLGFVTRLIFVGVELRIEAIENDFIKFKLGFSHFVFVKIPSSIKVFSPKKTLLVLKSIDEQLLKEFCSKICSFKALDVYKGKGILYKNQILILKEGKKK